MCLLLSGFMPFDNWQLAAAGHPAMPPEEERCQEPIVNRFLEEERCQKKKGRRKVAGTDCKSVPDTFSLSIVNRFLTPFLF
jgi:hypothetical protein